MASLALFLERLFRDGTIRVESERLPSEAGNAATELLKSAFDVYVLDLVGPKLELDSNVAIRAAKILYDVAWYYFHAGNVGQGAGREFHWEMKNPTLAQHASADLVLRYLPALHRRVKAVFPEDILVTVMEGVLRRWPLSGVLSDVSEPPTTPIEFADHKGLAWWYAERWAKHAKPRWLPNGRIRQHAEMVWQAAGRDLAAMPGEWNEDAVQT